jgi:hypothetical protein
MIEQCLYAKRDECNGMLKDANLNYTVNIHSVPYYFDFEGTKKKMNLRSKIREKIQDCADEIANAKEYNHELKLLNQLYNGGDMTGISTKCDKKCTNCIGCGFSDENRIQTAYYITGNDLDLIGDIIVKVKWYERETNKDIEKITMFKLNDIKKCDSVVFKNGNSRCCYTVEAYVQNYPYVRNSVNLSNSQKFPERFLNIMINHGKINFSITRPPSGGICMLGSFPDNETMY